MDKKRIIYITDMNMGGANPSEKAVTRSGYANIGIGLCRELSKEYHVTIMGIGYTGQEHREPFGIIPCQTMQDTVGYINNIKFAFGVDIVIVALDIHNFQEQLFPAIQKLGVKYICITPLESDPLCMTWANLLNQMDKVFFISKLGEDEAEKAGVEAEHIEIGIDTNSWRLRTDEEYKRVRMSLGYDDDDFVIMTVADNQERKDLGSGFQIIDILKKRGIKAKHILVTREHSMVGWKLWDLAWEVGISSDLKVFQSGMPFTELFTLYCAADAYLSCSKGEGLGLPVMEAMSMGIPVVANKTGALQELLRDDRGWLVPYSAWHYDPFGNQRRYWIDKEKAADALAEVNLHKVKKDETTQRARKYMESLSWEKSAKQVSDAIQDILQQKKTVD